MDQPGTIRVEQEEYFFVSRGWIVRPSPGIGDEITADGLTEEGELAVVCHVTSFQDNGMYLWYEYQDDPTMFYEETFVILPHPVKKVIRDRQAELDK